MASHRRPKKPSGKTVITLSAVAAGTAVFGAQPSFADPAPTVAQVKQQVSDLNNQVDQADEAYNQAQENLATQQAKITELQGKIATEQAALNAATQSLGGLARAEYRDGGLNEGLSLMLSEQPGQYLNNASTLNQLNSDQANTLLSIEDQQRQLRQDTSLASSLASQLQATRDQINTSRSTIQAELAQRQQLLSRLTAAQQAEVLAPADGTVSTKPSATAPQVTTGQAQEAIDFAYAQIGKPYVWGGSGPNSWDCSGLTQAAWRAAGVSLGRTTYDQYDEIQHVSISQLQPGDLVFFYNFGHVGIYIGNGEVIHAPHTGEDVQIAPMNSMPIAGAGRP